MKYVLHFIPLNQTISGIFLPYLPNKFPRMLVFLPLTSLSCHVLVPLVFKFKARADLHSCRSVRALSNLTFSAHLAQSSYLSPRLLVNVPLQGRSLTLYSTHTHTSLIYEITPENNAYNYSTTRLSLFVRVSISTSC